MESQGKRPSQRRRRSAGGAVFSLSTTEAMGSSSGAIGRQKKRRGTRTHKDGDGDGTVGRVMLPDKDGKAEHEEWVVEKVLRKFIDEDDVTWYMIKWKGWSSKYNSWEPVENLRNCMKLVKEFESKERKNAVRTEKRKSAERTRKKRKRVQAAPPPSRRREPSPEEPQPANDDLQIENVEVVEPDGQEQMDVAMAPDAAVGGENRGGNGQALVFVANRDFALAFDEEVDEERELRALDVGTDFRFAWRHDEIPLTIIGCAIFQNILIYVVRLKPDTEEETREVLKNPSDGVTQENTVAVPSSAFLHLFPDLIAEFFLQSVAYVP